MINRTLNTKVSATVNTSSIFDVCVKGQPRDVQSATNVGSLCFFQCLITFEYVGEEYQISEVRTLQIPHFYWCCARHIWTSLPPRFRGICGVCTLNDLLYVVHPVEFLPKHFKELRQKRETSEIMGYVHLKNTDLSDLATRYYALDQHFRIFTTQLVFKTIFWNTDLQYSNHNPLALPRMT